MSFTEIYRHGYNDGKYGFTYVNPNWTKEELAEYSKGYSDAKNESIIKIPNFIKL